jgi:uncharacterized small protein (DUF1192 family)
MEDDFEKKIQHLDQLIKEDLDQLSIEELEERINLLNIEVDRCSSKIKLKNSSKTSAESFFK